MAPKIKYKHFNAMINMDAKYQNAIVGAKYSNSYMYFSTIFLHALEGSQVDVRHYQLARFTNSFNQPSSC